MSAQTPQTDAIALRLPIGELRMSFDYDSIKQYNDLLALSRTLEAERDHYKALCEELKEALKVIAQGPEAESYERVSGAEYNMLVDIAREALRKAALKKAEKDI